MINIRQFSIFSLATFMAFIVTGCGDTNSDSSTNSNLKTYSVTLSGDNEVPAVTTSATGLGSITLNTDTNVVSGSFSFSGMTATVAHIHKGFAGSTGAALISLEETANNTFGIPENTELNASTLALFLNGGLYVNIHSAANPSGELRGQIIPSDVIVYKVTLSGGEEVPAITTAATGTAYLTVNKTSGNLYGTVKTSGMTPTASHIHTGTLGANGGILLGLEVDSNDANNYNVPANTELNTTTLAALANDELYINVHSATFPSGELRGQIVSDTTAAITSGKVKYDSTCVVCHSTDGSGGIGPDLRLLSTAFVKNKLTTSKASGAGQMGNVAKNLSDEEIENLSLYVETL